MFAFGATEWKPSLYEYVYMMSAHSSPLSNEEMQDDMGEVVK